MNLLDSALLSLAEKYGYKIGWAPISVLDDMQSEMRTVKSEMSEFSQQYFGDFESIEASKIDGMKTIIVISFPANEMNRAALDFGNYSCEVLIPTGYKNSKSKYSAPFENVSSLLKQNDVQCQQVQLPLKNLAVRLGIAEYGRNNVTYVEGFGSFHALVGIVCDCEFSQSAYPNICEPKRMDICDECGRCVKACTTGAICEDERMIDMEKCLTLYNEESDEWPQWLQKIPSHFLIGCGSCQLCCPVNKGRFNQNKTYRFSEEECREILQFSNSAQKGSQDDKSEIWESIQAKIDDVGLNGFENAVYHNIQMIYKNRN